MTPNPGFAAATAVHPDGPHRYRADLDAAWGAGGHPNGGYLLAVAARAALHATGCAHPHAVHGTFLRAARGGAATVEVAVLRAGRTATHARVTLSQDDAVAVEAHLVLGAAPAAADSDRAAAPVVLPAEQDCVPAVVRSARPGMLHRIALRYDPDASPYGPAPTGDPTAPDPTAPDPMAALYDPAAAPPAATAPSADTAPSAQPEPAQPVPTPAHAQPAPTTEPASAAGPVPSAGPAPATGPATVRAWFRLRDGSDPDPLTPLLAADALPPAVAMLGHRGWAPTVTLDAQLYHQPSPGPMAVSVTVGELRGGWFDEQATVSDAEGRVVAVTSQLARLPAP